MQDEIEALQADCGALAREVADREAAVREELVELCTEPLQRLRSLLDATLASLTSGEADEAADEAEGTPSSPAGSPRAVGGWTLGGRCGIPTSSTSMSPCGLECSWKTDPTACPVDASVCRCHAAQAVSAW